MPLARLRAVGACLVVFSLAISLPAQQPPTEPAAEPVAPEPVTAFPTTGILPKKDIGALRFLEEHPQFDGRGVLIAVFDTGIDPGAPGLRTTTDGKPKIVALFDGTGSGDVPLSEPVQSTDGRLEGLSGQPLTIDPKWKNPSGEYRLGLKSGYALFPSDLVRRLKRERREEFEEENRRIAADIRRQLDEWDASGLELDETEQAVRDDLADRLDALEHLIEHYDDPGPLYDVVAFHDGSVWRAVVDTDEDGDLRDETPLTNYRDEPRYATFSAGSLLNFTVTIEPDGSEVTLVVPAGSHGTHVAGIAAGHFPEQPERNGIAPGAQVVSIKIGDTRLDSMETGAGIVRGIQMALELGCDVINMSYGEPTTTPDEGRLAELLAEAVNEHGVIFVASAGNAGPALTTVGAPGGTTTAAIGVGAYLPPDLAATAYSLREPIPGRAYPWSSRGPAADGGIGVDVFAPGGAIAPVPRYTLRRSMRMNGTSMASPNAAGAVALLLSGLKADEIAHTPYSVRRALQTTAKIIPTADVFAQGAGLIQVDRAYEHLTQYADAPGEALHFDISLLGGDGGRGIYLREPHEIRDPSDHRIRIRPAWPKSADESRRADFEMRLTLRPTADWIACGKHLLLTDGGDTLTVHVDPTELEPGAYAEAVEFFDADRPERPAVFRIPISVIVPEECGTEDDSKEAAGGTFELDFDPGESRRVFLAVPDGATWAEATFTLTDAADEPHAYLMQCCQLVPGVTFEKTSSKQSLWLRPGVETRHRFAVIGGRTLDVSLVQDWSSLGRSGVRVDVQFFGLEPSDREVALTADMPGERIAVTALTGAVRLAPSAKLDRVQRFLAPSETDIRPLPTDTNLLPESRRVHELVATYHFDLSEPGRVTLRLPRNNDLLYDSPLGSQLTMLFDAAKRLIVTDDVFPESVQLERGRHTLRLQLRHTDPQKLEELTKARVVLERSLESAIDLKFYESRADAAAGRDTVSTRRLDAGETVPLFLAAPTSDDLPDRAQPGDRLLGTIHYGRSGGAGGGQRPGGWPLTCFVPVASEGEADGEAKDSDTDAPSSSEPKSLAEAVRDAKVEYLKSLDSAEQFDEFTALAERLIEKHPEHLPLLVARLHRLDDVQHRKERLPKIVDAADAVIDAIDTEALRKEYGRHIDPDDSKAQRERREADRLKAILTDALYRKGRALGYMELPEVVAEHPIEDPGALDNAFEENFAELASWVDTTDAKWGLLRVRRDRRDAHYGAALKLLNRYAEKEEPNHWYLKKRRDIYKKLGWQHAYKQERNRLAIHYPKAFAEF